MKVLITGGHFSPAYAIIQELQKISAEIVIVGRRHPFEGDTTSLSYEYRVSKELNVPFIELKTGRLQRRITYQSIPSLFRFGRGLRQAKKILADTKPDIVLTFGGYLSLPVALAAAMHHVPIVTHEQTQGLGLSNRVIARFASVVCVSFPESLKQFRSKKVVLTGNPLRANIFAVEDRLPHPTKLPVLYVTGGSTGSHVINMAVKEVLTDLIEHYVVIHQTGENQFNDYEVLQKAKSALPENLGDRYIVQKFVFPSQIGYVYKTADVVIGRSGANTVMEMIACNKPCLLIPLPHAQGGEQLRNAQLISKIGLGKVIRQDMLTPEVLLDAIHTMVKGIEKYHVSQSIIDTYVFKDSARRIVNELTALYEKKKKNTKN